jgi:hypothetical protein
VFDLIFGAATTTPTTPSSATINKVYKKSIIDYAKESVTALNAKLGTTDKKKLDEYMTGVREIETALNKVETTTAQQCVADMTRPADNNAFEAHTKLMLDLLFKAIQCGRSDVITYMMDCEVGYGYKNHHDASHLTEGGNATTLQQIDTWYVSQFAYLIGKLKGATEGGGTLLDNTCILYGSGSGGTANVDHSGSNLPLILAGKGKGSMPTQGRILVKNGMTHCNLLLTLLNRMGVATTKFGDSTGLIAEL